MMKKRTMVLIASVLIGFGIFFGISKANTTSQSKVYQQQISVKETKVDYSNLIIQGIEKINKLEVLQLNMNCKMTIHGSRYNNNLFRNDKIINLNTTTRYKIDIDDIKNDIIFSGDSVTVLVHIETEVIVNEDKISYQDDRGCLVFYDVEISPEDYNSMVIEAKNMMTEEMMREENYNEAKKIVEEKITEIVNTLGQGEYTINIRFI